MSVEYKVQGDRLIINASIDISSDAIARAKLSSTGKTRIVESSGRLTAAVVAGKRISFPLNVMRGR
ncbi:MAG TPA: hypothetical protein VKI44_20345 [Acetobacteraceae bacterium]|nr:hypothetical protein [Acetobacteraceae bacterium]